MNMIMDNNHHLNQQHQHHQGTPPLNSPQRPDFCASTTPPNAPLSPLLATNNNNNNNSSGKDDARNSPALSPPTNLLNNGKATTLKRSFDVAFLMMPDERIKQKQNEKQPRLAEYPERHQYPTDLSPRTTQNAAPQRANTTEQHHALSAQAPQQLPLMNCASQLDSVFNIHEARRYPQITVRSPPRIYDDPTLVLPPAAAADRRSPESMPLKSAFTKVCSMRLESPPVQPPAPPLSPDSQLSCSSMSPPAATTPPRTNSGGNGSLSSHGSNGSCAAAAPPGPPPCLNPNIIYQSFRPEYHQLNGAAAFQQSVNHMHMLQAQQRLKQQLLYRTPFGGPTSAAAALAATNNIGGGGGGGSASAGGSPNSMNSGGGPPPEFLPGYAAFPFPGAGAPHPFATVAAPPELPRIAQNPAAAAILTTLIPPTLASTFSLTAQNVCAKCNISFRMTSDLVYHMRSHHKSEVQCDPNRRKREEKLRCPVCQETFRERHHLTRHMTAHQDKESDNVSGSTAAGSNESSAERGSSGNMCNGGGGGGGGGRHHAASSSSRIPGVTK